MWLIIVIALASLCLGVVFGTIRERKSNKSKTYTYSELKTWLINRDVYLYNHYTTHQKSNIPIISIDDMIEDDHEYLMERKLIK